MSARSIHIAELEMLQSMFNSEELRLDTEIGAEFEDPDHDFIPISFVLNLDIEMKVQASVTLPADYPAVEPEIFVRCEVLDKCQQAQLNKELQNYITNLERGEICIYAAVSWLQENTVRFKQHEILAPESQNITEDKLARLWIYSHHIYNKDKRKNISAYAHQNNCSGFTLPGRPGIICIEGIEADCEDVWQKIRNMNWKKIMLRKKEDCIERVFSNFEEKSFNKCKNERHMDMGEFLKYLNQHNCGYIFKEYFGVNGKIADDN